MSDLSLESVANTVIGSGPVAAVLFYWVWSERKERRDLQKLLLKMLESTAGLAEATRDELKRLRGVVDSERPRR